MRHNQKPAYMPLCSLIYIMTQPLASQHSRSPETINTGLYHPLLNVASADPPSSTFTTPLLFGSTSKRKPADARYLRHQFGLSE